LANFEDGECLNALRHVRSRLEGHLNDNEFWQALNARAARSGSREHAEPVPGDSRLELALERNAHYRAWVHIGQAIAALSKTAWMDAPPSGVDNLPAAASAQQGKAAPEGGAAAIAGHRAALGGPKAFGAQEGIGRAAAPQGVRAVLTQMANSGHDVDPTITPASFAGLAAASPKAFTALAKIPSVEPISQVLPGRHGVAEWQPRPVAGQDDQPPVESSEALVTFVIRNPAPMLAEPPDQNGRSPLLQRLRANEPPTGATGGQQLPPAVVEEAKVTIIEREHVANAGIVRRVLRSLSGT
jgi:hypothetical protein